MNAHKHEWTYGNTPEWADSVPPDVTAGRPTGLLRRCSWCGSMHPADVAAAILAGARAHFADWKYGWPHKVYLDAVPNPHAGMPESRAGASSPPQAEIDAGKWTRVADGFSPTTGEPLFTWAAAPAPASLTTWGKFYTVHFQDATDEDKAVIEAHLNMRFTFQDDGGRVQWEQIVPAASGAS